MDFIFIETSAETLHRSNLCDKDTMLMGRIALALHGTGLLGLNEIVLASKKSNEAIARIQKSLKGF